PCAAGQRQKLSINVCANIPGRQSGWPGYWASWQDTASPGDISGMAIHLPGRLVGLDGLQEGKKPSFIGIQAAGLRCGLLRRQAIFEVRLNDGRMDVALAAHRWCIS